jgi:hypothetical protein
VQQGRIISACPILITDVMICADSIAHLLCAASYTTSVVWSFVAHQKFAADSGLRM